MRITSLSDSISNTIYRQIGRARGQVQEHRPIPVDVLEGEDTYLVIFDAPGVETEDVQVRYLDGTVKIRIDRFREYYDGFEMRFPGRGMTLEGEIELPDGAVVEPDAGTARLTETGSLSIEIPKDPSHEPTESEQIRIED